MTVEFVDCICWESPPFSNCAPDRCCGHVGGYPAVWEVTSPAGLVLDGAAGSCTGTEGYTWLMTYDDGEGGWLGTIDLTGLLEPGYDQPLDLKFTCDPQTGAQTTYYRNPNGGWTPLPPGQGFVIGDWHVGPDPFTGIPDCFDDCTPFRGTFSVALLAYQPGEVRVWYCLGGALLGFEGLYVAGVVMEP